MIDENEVSSLRLPDGFGIELDLQTGEVRKQVGPGQYEISHFELLANSYLLRSVARKLLARFRWTKDSGTEVPAYRVVRCGMGLLDQNKGVSIYRSIVRNRKHAHFGGIVQCGSVWHCAVCAKKIAARRVAEMIMAINRLLESGGVCGLLTCTVPHIQSDQCAEVLNKLQNMFDRLNSGKSAKAFRQNFGVLGQVRALEFTKGINGWHPHVHSLLFCEKPLSWAEVGDSLWHRWASVARKLYGWELPRAAVDVRGGTSAASYVSKWGSERELVSGVYKVGKGESLNPFELLGQYAEGNKSAGDDWVEYATSVCRMGQNRIESSRQLVWSRGLKSRFQIADLTDEQIAEQQEEPAVLLGTLNFEQWLKILGQPYDARVVLLQIATLGNFADVMDYVKNLPPPVGKSIYERHE